MKFVMFSDTHGNYVDLPDGDCLIYAGDWSSGRGTLVETHKFIEYMGSQPHPIKVAVPGNHDFPADTHAVIVRNLFEKNGIAYLINERTYASDIDFPARKIQIWGSPYHPKIWGKFELERGDLQAIWSLVPEDIEILVTHGPPYGILDHTDEKHGNTNVGDNSLNEFYLKHKMKGTKAPIVHVFGHIHEGYGQSRIGNTRFINASVCDADYNPVNEPVVWEY